MLPSKSAVPQNTITSGPPNSLQKPIARTNWTPASLITLALSGAAATVLRFLFLARKPFWFDECFSVEIARMRWHDFVRLLWWREANMSLYYLLLRVWLHFGSSPFFIRSFSVLFSLATLPAIFWLAQKLFERRVAVIAVALMSCNAYSIRYAQEARSYSLFVLLSTLSSAFFVGLLREPSRNNQRRYIWTSICAAYAHFYALLLLTAQLLSERMAGDEVSADPEVHAAQQRAWLYRPWLYICIAVLPVLVFVAKTGAGPIRWIWRPGLHDVLDFWEHLAGNAGWPVLLLYAAACVAAILPLRARLLTRYADWNIWRIQFLLIWLLFPVALALLLSLARPVFLARYFIFCLPPFIILAAAGLASLRKPWMTAVCLSVILLLSLQGTISYYGHDFDVERDDSQAATNYILDHAQPGDAILFHIAEGRIPYEYFGSLRAGSSQSGVPARPEIVFPRHGGQLDYRDVTGKPTLELLRSLPSRYARVWVVLMSNQNAGHPDATTVMLDQTLSETFPRIERVQFPQVEVGLYRKP